MNAKFAIIKLVILLIYNYVMFFILKFVYNVNNNVYNILIMIVLISVHKTNYYNNIIIIYNYN